MIEFEFWDAGAAVQRAAVASKSPRDRKPKRVKESAVEAHASAISAREHVQALSSELCSQLGAQQWFRHIHTCSDIYSWAHPHMRISLQCCALSCWYTGYGAVILVEVVLDVYSSRMLKVVIL